MKYIISLLVVFLGIGIASGASIFEDNLISQGINVKVIKTASAIGRYDTARLLNAAECRDCIVPSKQDIAYYNQTRFKQFVIQPDNFFSDISYPAAYVGKYNYYYCVAYAGDKGYINGYPKAVSPYCPGRFCGTANLSYAELIQVVTNIAVKYPNNTYRLNWDKALSWINQLDKGTIEYKYFNASDYQIFKTKASNCSTNCETNSPTELNTYLKYCAFNLGECGMNNSAGLKEGQYPIAEINYLEKEQIITQDQLDQMRGRWYEPAPGALVLSMLAAVNKKSACLFNNDYDKDGILNSNDTCPYLATSDNSDTDKDGIGDACDRDIDNDTVCNKLGILHKGHAGDANDTGCGKIDNCTYNPNTPQKDSNGNGFGDECDIEAWGGLAISGKPLIGYRALPVQFTCQQSGTIPEIIWNFGDGNTAKGCNPNNTFRQSGRYYVTATAGKLFASLYVTVLEDTKTSLIIQPNPYITTPGNPITITPFATGQCQRIRRSTDGVDKITALEPYIYTYQLPARYPILAQCLQGDKITAIAQTTVNVTNETNKKASSLTVNNARPFVNEQVMFLTTIKGFTKNLISGITWEMGDATTKNNTNLESTHKYATQGQKLIHQIITTTDNAILENYLTLYVQTIGDSATVTLNASPLIQQLGKKVKYQLNPIGFGYKDVSSIVCDMGDNQNRQWTPKKELDFTFEHLYSQIGTFRTTCNLTLTDNTSLTAAATVSIVSSGLTGDICRNYRCDLDKDQIPDLCDIDIDGDGTNNLMGILIAENNDCSIDERIIEKTIEKSEHEQAKDGEKIDNCPFVLNKDQKDDNQNGYGNLCESEGSNCPGIDPSIKLKNCPISPGGGPAGDTTITPVNCSVCPCPTFVSSADQIRALLRSIDGEIIQAISNPISFK